MLDGETILLNNYRMDPNLVKAFCSFVLQSHSSGLGNFSQRSSNIDTVIINNCGLDDLQVAMILQILYKFREPNQVSITKDELGKETVTVLLSIL